MGKNKRAPPENDKSKIFMKEGIKKLLQCTSLDNVRQHVRDNYQYAPPIKERNISDTFQPFFRNNNQTLSAICMMLDFMADELYKRKLGRGDGSPFIFKLLVDDLKGAKSFRDDIFAFILKSRDKEINEKLIVELLIFNTEIQLLMENKLPNREHQEVVLLDYLDLRPPGKDGMISRLLKGISGSGQKPAPSGNPKKAPGAAGIRCHVPTCGKKAKSRCKRCNKCVCMDHHNYGHTDHPTEDLPKNWEPEDEEESPDGQALRADEKMYCDIDEPRLEEVKKNEQHIVNILRGENPTNLLYRVSRVLDKEFNEEEFRKAGDAREAVRNLFDEEELDDEIIDDALSCSRGDPDEAAGLIKRLLDESVEFLQQKSEMEVGKPVISAARAKALAKKTRFNEQAMLILMNEDILNAVPRRKEVRELQQVLKDLYLDEDERIKIAAQELFDHCPDRMDRGSVLLKMLSFEMGNKQPRGKEGWWLDFNNFSFDELVTCVEDMNHPEDEDAPINCSMLNNECAICTEYFHKNKIFEMECQCIYCYRCVVENLKSAMGKGLEDAFQCLSPSCPNKQVHESMDEDARRNSFTLKYQRLQEIAKYDPELKPIIEKFDKNFQDYTAENIEHFTRCAHCEFGQVRGDLNQKKMTCWQCNKYTCYDCKFQWYEEHEGLSCPKYRDWLAKNHPDLLGLQHGADPGSFIECPHCKHHYLLQRGGCLHFTCSHCKHEFCGSCYQTFYTINNPCELCAVERQSGSGIHAHHPRHCYYYLRDETVDWLIELLEMHEVEWKDGVPDTPPKDGLCPIRVTNDKSEEHDCGNEPFEGRNLCEKHMKEFLSMIIFEKNVDPIKKLEQNQLNALISRENIKLPNPGMSIDDLRTFIAGVRPLVEEEEEELED